MYKFTNINIDHLIGSEIIEVSIYSYNLLFRLEPENFINISGKWEIRTKDGAILDSGNAQKHNVVIKAHHLLQTKVEGYDVPSPEELHIKFSDNSTLVIYDDEPQYECCSISPAIYI